MKTKFFFLSALLAAGLQLQASVLSSATAVHLQPQETAPVVTYLKAGSSISTSTQAAPSGWLAIELKDSLEAYVAKKDLNKSLDVRPGAEFHSQPKPESPVISTMDPGDKVEITGARGRWMQVMIKKNITGYIRSSAAPSAAPVAPIGNAASTKTAVAPAVSTPAAAKPTPVPVQIARTPAPAPVSTPAPLPTPAVTSAASGGRAVPMGSEIDGGSAALPRSYLGKFISTRRPFAPRRPFDYQINDDSGVRFAYLDLSKLMLTDNLEKYLDRDVIVFGVAKNTNEGKDIVIEVETLQLK